MFHARETSPSSRHVRIEFRFGADDEFVQKFSLVADHKAHGLALLERELVRARSACCRLMDSVTVRVADLASPAMPQGFCSRLAVAVLSVPCAASPCAKAGAGAKVNAVVAMTAMRESVKVFIVCMFQIVEFDSVRRV
jgi:hypothetical protein